MHAWLQEVAARENGLAVVLFPLVAAVTGNGLGVSETGVPPEIGQVGIVPQAPATVWSTMAQLRFTLPVLFTVTVELNVLAPGAVGTQFLLVLNSGFVHCIRAMSKAETVTSAPRLALPWHVQSI